jgi:hypothetical protein
MAQIPVEIQDAILGNVGSLVAFSLGAADAEIVHKEYSEVFSQSDMVNLARHQVAVKQMIDGHPSRPFLAHTLPLPAIKHDLKDFIIQNSRQNWGVKFEPYKTPDVPAVESTNTPTPRARYDDYQPTLSQSRNYERASESGDGSESRRRRPRNRGPRKDGENRPAPVHHHDTWKNPKFYGPNANANNRPIQPPQSQTKQEENQPEQKKPVETPMKVDIYDSSKGS